MTKSCIEVEKIIADIIETPCTQKKKNEENITHKLHKMDKLEITSWVGMIASSYYLKHKFYKKA